MVLLDSSMERDKFSMKNGEYTIRSIYFDNSHEEKENKKITKRYRIRMYNNDIESIFLEKKSAEKGYVEKSKCKIQKIDVINILNRKL